MNYPELNFNIVLIEPEIPANTGNIGRTCVGTWSKLHLVEPLGFEISDKRVKRAGLDYWPHLDWECHKSWEHLTPQIPVMDRVFYFSTKAKNPLYHAKFQPGDWMVFGKETKGLDEAILEKYPERCFQIPFPGPIRSFNLSNAVAMVLSEGIRQLKFSPQTRL